MNLSLSRLVAVSCLVVVLVALRLFIVADVFAQGTITPLPTSEARTLLTPLILIQTVDTSAFSPPMPDPSGIAYMPTTGIFLISDAEVDEMPAYFTGFNVFGVTSKNILSYTLTTVSFSNEPAGIAHNPNNGHIFYADDNKKRIYEISPGADDVRTSFSTIPFESRDPEGLDYDPTSGDLFIVDGINAEVYRINPGANGVFDGVPADGGDDSITSFDTAINNILDPEGIAFDPTSGNLLLLGKSRTKIYEVTVTGGFVQTFDVSAAHAIALAGIEIAPSSVEPGVMNYYLVDRGIDNDIDPAENDGKLYEFAFPKQVFFPLVAR